MENINKQCKFLTAEEILFKKCQENLNDYYDDVFSNNSNCLNIYVAFSGGQDSTVVLHSLYEYLLSRDVNSNKDSEGNYVINLMTIRSSQFGLTKERREARARAEIISKLKSISQRITLVEHDLNITNEMIAYRHSQIYVYSMFHPYMKNDSVLFTGFIESDFIYSFTEMNGSKKVEVLHETFNSLNKLSSKPNIGIGHPLLRSEQPLNRKTIVNYLLQTDLFVNTTWCNSDEEEVPLNCDCSACSKHRKELGE